MGISDGLVDIDGINDGNADESLATNDGDEERIFSGWMFAESPGLNAVEHPVFDVWLTGCVKPDAESLRQSAARQQRNSAQKFGPPRQRQRRPRRRIRR